jgi:hypothetical protein
MQQERLMNAEATTGIGELTVEEMEGVTGGFTPAFLFPVISSMYTSLVLSFGGCVEDETGNGTTIGNCDTF